MTVDAVAAPLERSTAQSRCTKCRSVTAAPVASTPGRYSLVIATRYRMLVAGSITGVPRMQTSGLTSLVLIVSLLPLMPLLATVALAPTGETPVVGVRFVGLVTFR